MTISLLISLKHISLKHDQLFAMRSIPEQRGGMPVRTASRPERNSLYYDDMSESSSCRPTPREGANFQDLAGSSRQGTDSALLDSPLPEPSPESSRQSSSQPSWRAKPSPQSSPRPTMAASAPEHSLPSQHSIITLSDAEYAPRTDDPINY